MTTNSFVTIDIPEAKLLADLTGILHDFLNARRFAQQLSAMLNQTPPDYTLVEPMTTAILIRYFRPFASGLRERFTESDLATLSPEMRAEHDRFKHWRDKHIAHPVNAFEENQPRARYWVERFDEEGFTSVDCVSHHLAGLSLQDIYLVMRLCDHWMEVLEPRMMAEQEKALAAVRALPKETVLAMDKPARRIEPGQVGKRRKT